MLFSLRHTLSQSTFAFGVIPVAAYDMRSTPDGGRGEEEKREPSGVADPQTSSLYVPPSKRAEGGKIPHPDDSTKKIERIRGLKHIYSWQPSDGTQNQLLLDKTAVRY